MVQVAAILCADWSAHVQGRAVYAASVKDRTVWRIESRWRLQTVLDAASMLAVGGPALAAFDVALGVPRSFLDATPGLSPAPDFLEFLTLVEHVPDFYTATRVASQWSVRQPFFAVPKGQGGLRSYLEAAASQGVSLFREIDILAKAKTPFAVSGIPGSVGGAARSLWQELAPLLRIPDRALLVWPFEPLPGAGQGLSASKGPRVIIGEVYPRAAYGMALGLKRRISLAKRSPGVRRNAMDALQEAPWVRQHRVQVSDLDAALSNENDFDACLTALALLRCCLEGVDLFHSPGDQRALLAEGGMLAAAGLDGSLSEAKELCVSSSADCI